MNMESFGAFRLPRWARSATCWALLCLPAMAVLASNALAISGDDEFRWHSHLTITDDTQHFHQIGFSPDGTRFFGLSDQTVFVWNTSDGTEVAQFSHQRRAINAALSADNTALITTSEFRLARIWDLATGVLLQSFGDESQSMRPGLEFVAWPPQGPRAVQNNSDWSLSMFDAMDGTQLLHLSQITTRMVRLLFSTTGDRIVTAEANGHIRVFDSETGEQLLLHDRHDEQAQIAISSDGQRAVSIAPDGMEVWDINTGALIRRWDDHGYRSWNSPSFSSDGSAIAVLYRASLDGFRILDIVTGETLLALPGSASSDLQRQPLQVQFAPDGTRIMTSHGASIRIWDLDDRFVAGAIEPPAPAIASPQPAPEKVKADAIAKFSTTEGGRTAISDSSDLLPELLALASEGQLTVRALRGWGRLPERFSQLALELRRHDIDLLAADQAAVEALAARAPETPYLSDKVQELEELAQLLSQYSGPSPDTEHAIASALEPASETTENLPPDGVPGWILVSAEERSGQNTDNHQRTFSFSFQSDGAVDRAQVRQSGQGYSRQVNLAFDFNWDEPPRFAFKQDTWQGGIEVRNVGSSVDYLSGSAPEIDPRSGGFAVSAQYRSGTRPIMDRGSAATGRFSPDNPDSIGTPMGEAEIRWPERGCPGDQFTIEMRVNSWSGRGTIVWTYEYHPNLLRSPIFSEQFEALQSAHPPAPDHAPAEVEIIQDCPTCPEMVVILAGRFLMGSPETEYGRQAHEGPQTEITITHDFAIARTPITQAQWSALMDSRPFRFQDCPDCPADNISHAEARQYLRQLSEKTGQEYRLPSAAEWEYACRAGGNHRYCGSNDIDEVAWYRCNSEEKTWPVASKAGNAFGLHDMSGNVMEWTRDCYTPDYELMPTDGSPLREGSSCTQMVSRGGSWFSTEDYARAAARSSGGMVGEDGFRPVRILEVSNGVPSEEDD